MSRPRQIQRPTTIARSFATANRTLNTAFQLSTTRDCRVDYGIDIRVQSLLLGAAQGTVTLQYADNAGMSANLVTLMSGTNRTSGVLNIDNTNTAGLGGIIPVGKFCRIASAVNAGTATFTTAVGQEVLL